MYSKDKKYKAKAGSVICDHLWVILVTVAFGQGYPKIFRISSPLPTLQRPLTVVPQTSLQYKSFLLRPSCLFFVHSPLPFASWHLWDTVL